MAKRLLIGSSNVARFFDPKKVKQHEGCRLEKCFRIEEFRVRIGNLSSLNNLDSVTISVIENFLCDAIGAEPEPETFDKIVGEVCEEFCKLVGKVSERIPHTLILVVKPINRPKYKWFSDTYYDICNYIGARVKKCKMKNVVRLGDCLTTR